VIDEKNETLVIQALTFYENQIKKLIFRYKEKAQSELVPEEKVKLHLQIHIRTIGISVINLLQLKNSRSNLPSSMKVAQFHRIELFFLQIKEFEALVVETDKFRDVQLRI